MEGVDALRLRSERFVSKVDEFGCSFLGVFGQVVTKSFG